MPRPLGPPIAEFLILLTGLTASERLVNTLATPVTISPLLFAPLPFLLWAAVRFGQAGLGVVLCFTTLFRYFAGAHPGQGLATPPDAIVATQLTLIAMSLPLVVLSALLAERRRSEEALRQSHSRYGLATIAGSVGVWDWNIVTNAVYVDPSLKSLLGFADARNRVTTPTIGNRACRPTIWSGCRRRRRRTWPRVRRRSRLRFACCTGMAASAISTSAGQSSNARPDERSG